MPRSKNITIQVINKTQFDIDLYEAYEGVEKRIQQLKPHVAGKDDYYSLKIIKKRSRYEYRLYGPHKVLVESRSGVILDSMFLKGNVKAITIEYDGQAFVWSATSNKDKQGN